MMKYTMKKIVLICLTVLVVILIPVVINVLVSIPVFEGCSYPVVGKPADWLYFLASYLGSIASFVMIFYTAKSLRQNQRQLAEMKRQWNEEHRARLVFSLADKEGDIVLKVSNVGQEAARNVNLKFSDAFIDSLFVQYIRDVYVGLKDKFFTVGAGEDKFFMLSSNWGNNGVVQFYVTKEEVKSTEFIEWLNSHRSMPIEFTGSYRSHNEVYSINETLKIEDYFFGSLVVRNDLTNAVIAIRKGLVQGKDQYSTIQKSLDTIATILKQNQEARVGHL